MTELGMASGFLIGLIIGMVVGFIVIGLGFRRYINNLRDKAVGHAADFAVDTAKTVGKRGFSMWRDRKKVPTA